MASVLILPPMPYVDSTSSYDQVRAALADNASWAVENNVGMAKLYAVAAQVYLDVWAFDKSILGPSEQERASLNRSLQARLQSAQQFVMSNRTGGGGVIRLSTANFRGAL